MEKKITIDKLARMVQKGFEDTASKQDVGEIRNDIVEVRKDIKEIKEILLKQHDWRITALEREVKSIKEQFLLK